MTPLGRQSPVPIDIHMQSGFQDTDPLLLAAAKYMRNESASGVKIFEGVMAEKRVDVFKGASAIRALMSDSYKKCKKVPKVESKADAEKVLKGMLDAGLFIRSTSINGTRFLQPDLSRSWSEDALYAWILPSSQFWTLLGAFALLAVSFALVMFPLWPFWMRNMAWYVMMACVAFLVFLIVISIIRLIVFGITFWTMKPGIWIFPNLYEDVSFIDSFIPLWDWHKPESAAETKKED